MSTSYGLSLPYVNPYTLASQTCYAYAAQINLCPAGQTGQITFLIFPTKAAADAGAQPIGTEIIDIIRDDDGSGRPVYSDLVATYQTLFGSLAAACQTVGLAHVPNSSAYV